MRAIIHRHPASHAHFQEQTRFDEAHQEGAGASKHQSARRCTLRRYLPSLRSRGSVRSEALPAVLMMGTFLEVLWRVRPTIRLSHSVSRLWRSGCILVTSRSRPVTFCLTKTS